MCIKCTITQCTFMHQALHVCCVGMMMKELMQAYNLPHAHASVASWLHSVIRVVVKRCANPLGKLPAAIVYTPLSLPVYTKVYDWAMIIDCITNWRHSQSYDDWWEMQSALESVCTPHGPTCTKVDYYVHVQSWYTCIYNMYITSTQIRHLHIRNNFCMHYSGTSLLRASKLRTPPSYRRPSTVPNDRP